MAFDVKISAWARALLSKNLSSLDEELLAGCCQSAQNELIARLRDDVPADIEDCFNRAAGCMAAAAYIEVDTRQFEGFSPTGYRTQGRDPAQTRASAEALRRQAELMMVGYLKDREFAFKAVRADAGRGH